MKNYLHKFMSFFLVKVAPFLVIASLSLGAYTPTKTRTITATRTITKTATFSPTMTPTKNWTATRTKSPTRTVTSTTTPTSTASPILFDTPTTTSTLTPTTSVTSTTTASSTQSLTFTFSPTSTKTPTVTKTMTLTMTQTTSPTPTDTFTPEHEWPLATDATDIVGGATFDLTNTGSVPFTTVDGLTCAGKFSDTKYFDTPAALNSYIQAADLSAFTIEFQVRVDGSGISDSAFAYYFQGGSFAQGIWMSFNRSGSAYSNVSGFEGNATSIGTTTSTNLPATTWTTIREVFGPGTLDIYMDGILRAHGVGTTPTLSSISSGRFGRAAGNQPVIGYMREIRMWGAAVAP